MEVIGAGFPRTGTMSLKIALNILGYNSYHMEEVAKNIHNGHLNMWHDYITQGTPIDWDELYKDYDATTDFPSAYYYKELLQHYPNAKVILGIRDKEKWYNSISKLTKFSEALKQFWLPNNIRLFGKMTTEHFYIAFGKPFTKEKIINAYRAHVKEVKATVPPEQLLIFNPKDGWLPLCQFLDKPVPDVPFPHANSGMQTLNKLRTKYLAQELQARPLPLLLVLLVLALIIYLLIAM